MNGGLKVACSGNRPSKDTSEFLFWSELGMDLSLAFSGGHPANDAAKRDGLTQPREVATWTLSKETIACAHRPLVISGDHGDCAIAYSAGSFISGKVLIVRMLHLY